MTPVTTSFVRRHNHFFLIIMQPEKPFGTGWLRLDCALRDPRTPAWSPNKHWHNQNIELACETLISEHKDLLIFLKLCITCDCCELRPLKPKLCSQMGYLHLDLKNAFTKLVPFSAVRWDSGGSSRVVFRGYWFFISGAFKATEDALHGWPFVLTLPELFRLILNIFLMRSEVGSSDTVTGPAPHVYGNQTQMDRERCTRHQHTYFTSYTR